MKLSRRENDVLLCIADGLVEKEIAKKLGLKPGTVHSYVNSMKNKMHASTHAHAVGIYFKEYPKWTPTKRLKFK